MKLIWRFGEEAICPVCNGRNACLYEHDSNAYRCRDCKRLFRQIGQVVIVDRDRILGRPIGEAPCEELVEEPAAKEVSQ